MNQIPQRNYDYLFKIVIAGERRVGKSSLLDQFVNGKFSDNFISRMGIEFMISTLEINTKRIKLQIWDPSGGERCTPQRPSYYRRAHGMLVVYDITNRESFIDVDMQIANLRNYGYLNISIVLVGNKCDQEDLRQVSREEGELKAKEVGAMFMETSAKDATNVKAAFEMLAADCLLKVESESFERALPSMKAIKLTEKANKSDNGEIIKYNVCC